MGLVFCGEHHQLGGYGLVARNDASVCLSQGRGREGNGREGKGIAGKGLGWDVLEIGGK